MKISKTMLRKIIKEEIELQEMDFPHPSSWSPGEILSPEEQARRNPQRIPAHVAKRLDMGVVMDVGWQHSASVSSAAYQGAGAQGVVFSLDYKNASMSNRYVVDGANAVKTPSYDKVLQLWWRPTGQ
tara:strand:- start:3084 stop:3464 length:381 start_codon:yes stop_codon:yes gene_type:complete